MKLVKIKNEYINAENVDAILLEPYFNDNHMLPAGYYVAIYAKNAKLKLYYSNQHQAEKKIEEIAKLIDNATKTTKYWRKR